MSNRSFIEQWIDEPQKDRKHQNLLAQGGVLYSYGTNFPVARKVDGVYLITSIESSRATNRHINITWYAIRETSFIVPNVLADTTEAHKENYDAMIERVDKLRSKAKRAYKHGDIYTTKAGDVQDHADVYHKQFCSQVDPNLSWQNTSRPTSFITLT